MAGIEKVQEYSLYWSKLDLSSPSTCTKLLSSCKMWTWNAILKHRRNLFIELSPYVEHCCFMTNVWDPAVSSRWLWNYKSQSQQGWWKLCNGNAITKDTGWEGSYAHAFSLSLSQLLIILPWLSLTVVSRWVQTSEPSPQSFLVARKLLLDVRACAKAADVPGLDLTLHSPTKPLVTLLQNSCLAARIMNQAEGR